MMEHSNSIFRTSRLELLTNNSVDGSNKTILLNNGDSFYLLSGINALICMRFKIYTESDSRIEILLGEQVLYSSNVLGLRDENIYFVVSPGNNILKFNFSGSRSFGCFSNFIESSKAFDFVIVDPKLEVLAQ